MSTIEITCCARGRVEIVDYGASPEGLLWVLASDTTKLLHDCPFCGARLPDGLDAAETHESERMVPCEYKEIVFGSGFIPFSPYKWSDAELAAISSVFSNVGGAAKAGAAEIVALVKELTQADLVKRRAKNKRKRERRVRRGK